MVQIEARRSQSEIPRWAHLQRVLIDTMNETAEPVVEKYLYPDGRFMWPHNEAEFVSIDGLDDAYESFHNWPLFYLLGGDEKFLTYSHREFEAITGQFSAYPTGHGHPMVVNEYEQGYDWMHQGEGYQFFYLLNLADPGPTNRMRSIRFAGYYLNEDRSIEPIYDETKKMLKCCYVGSMGPGHRNFTGEAWGYVDWKSLYGLPFHDLEGVDTVEDLKVEAKAEAMGRAMKERLAYGDTVVNLFATSMVMNAYLYTGESKYKRWIDEYTEAWRERTLENEGLIPDNVGPNGVVGETLGGRWYGGHYGWTWPHGLRFIMEAVITAAQNRTLADRSDEMAWPRDLLDTMMAKGIERDGTLYVPQKHADPNSIQEYAASNKFLFDPDLPRVTRRTDFKRMLERDGWYEYRAMPSAVSANIFTVTHARADMERSRKLRNNKTGTHLTIKHFYAKNQGGHDDAWLNFLDGGYPNYPEEILEHNLFQVFDRIKRMREDSETPSEYYNDYLQKRNPITCEGLVQLTMGGPLPLYNGGLLQVSLRYFFLAARTATDGAPGEGETTVRPGLPRGVAALVHTITDETVAVTFVNTSAAETKRMMVQAGAYGEHQFTEINSSEVGGTETTTLVNDKIFELVLHPGSVIHMDLGMSRFCNHPSYAFPSSDHA